MRSASDAALCKVIPHHGNAALSAKGLSLTFGMATGFLYHSTEFPPTARHASRLPTAGQNVERNTNRPRFPAALSGLGSAVSLSEVG